MVQTQIAARGIADAAVLEAMRTVPRHRFVPGHALVDAYADRALVTLHHQTISQPYVVGLMTQLLEVLPGMRVLEVGTGSGYQTAVLLAMGADVVTIERHRALADEADALLRELFPSASCKVVVGDGTLGSPDDAPFDRIIVTAGAPGLPVALRQQLADGGRIVIPTGTREEQVLVTFQLHNGRWLDTHSLPCRFVPLLGEDGWADEPER